MVTYYSPDALWFADAIKRKKEISKVEHPFRSHWRLDDGFPYFLYLTGISCDNTIDRDTWCTSFYKWDRFVRVVESAEKQDGNQNLPYSS